MSVARIIAPTETDPLYFDFTKWDGPTPPLVREHIETFSVPGLDGTGSRLTGVYGDAFTVRTQAAYAAWTSTDPEVLSAEHAYRYRELIGQVCGLIYEGTEYFDIHNTDYLVESVEIDQFKKNVRLIGPGYDFPLGVIVTATWTLRPIFMGEGEAVPPPGEPGDGPPIDGFRGFAT